MERVKAHNSNSGNIAEYGWEPTATNGTGTLEVCFSTKKGTSVYQYPNVPQNLWVGLLHAPSAGNYLNAEIKPTYPAQRVQ